MGATIVLTRTQWPLCQIVRREAEVVLNGKEPGKKP